MHKNPISLYCKGKITKNRIKEIFKEIIPQSCFKFLPISFDDINNLNEKINNPEENLFFCCILTGRIETAKIFWKYGKVKLFFKLFHFCFNYF